MSERLLLASALKNGEAFHRVERHVHTDDLSSQGRVIWEVMSEFYSRDGKAKGCDELIIRNMIDQRIKNPKHQQVFTGIMNNLVAQECSPANVVQDFIAVKRDNIGGLLATALAAGNKDDIDKYLLEYNEWDAVEQLEKAEEEEAFNDYDLVKLVEETYSARSMIQLYPRALASQLDGGVIKGYHVLVFARPEMGKTAFVINLMYGFVQQGLKVLYAGNEDPIRAVIIRMVSRLTGLSKNMIINDPKTANKAARDKGYGMVTFKPMTPGSARQLENLCNKHEPDVLIVDQLRNLETKGDENRTCSLETAAKGVRTVAQRCDVLAISITQAGASAEDMAGNTKAVLRMGDVDGSNTGIQATADVMIGVGAAPDDITANRRVLSLCKNKTGGDHAVVPVKFDKTISKFESIA